MLTLCLSMLIIGIYNILFAIVVPFAIFENQALFKHLQALYGWIGTGFALILFVFCFCFFDVTFFYFCK